MSQKATHKTLLRVRPEGLVAGSIPAPSCALSRDCKVKELCKRNHKVEMICHEVSYYEGAAEESQ